MSSPVVIKIGGHEIDDPAFLDALAPTIKSLNQPVIIVHGGGKEISTLQRQLGIEPRYIDGLRITDAESLAIVQMVLCGVVNKRLVQKLMAGGIDALGLSGVDRGAVRAERMPHPNEDMAFTGQVTQVRAEVFLELLEQGITPVVAPISLGDDCAYNVNADHVAGAIASAVKASKVVFLTNVEGVLVDDARVATLTLEQAEALIADGTIFGGMIPKVQTALHALDGEVQQAVITNLQGLGSHGGTVFTRTGVK